MEKEIKEKEIITAEEDIDESYPKKIENNENRDFYVYAHIRLDKMETFYIGKGKGERAYDLARNEHHDNISNKYGHAVVIIKDNLTEEEAFELERDTIEDYVFNLGYGIDIIGFNNEEDEIGHLTNCTWGGEGSSGFHHSEETKQKISESEKGEKHYMYGKHRSEETKRKMSEIMSGENNPMYGKYHSEEAKLKMSKKIICTTTSEIFNSITEAGNYYNVAHIVECCKGRYKSAGKLPNGEPLRWKYLENCDDNDLKGILINPITLVMG